MQNLDTRAGWEQTFCIDWGFNSCDSQSRRRCELWRTSGLSAQHVYQARIWWEV